MNDQGRTVVVAESDPDLLGMMERALHEEGLSVHTAMDGFRAVEMVCEEAPDLAILGYYLPNLSGLRVCRFLKNREETADLLVVIISPTSDNRIQRRARWAGVDRVLALPFGVDELVGLCGGLLSGCEASLEPFRCADPESIRDILCDMLEHRVEHLESVRELAERLDLSTSAREVFMRIAEGVLTGLGMDRVWIARYLPETDQLLTEATVGRGLSDEASPISLEERPDMPEAVAVRERRVVRSSELHLPPQRLVWAGSTDYIDVPLLARGRVLGLLRCDHLVSGRGFTSEETEALKQYADQAAPTLFNSLGVEEMSEGQEQMSSILGSLDSAVVVVDSKQIVLEATSRVKDLFGKQPGEMRGRPLDEVVPILGREERARMLQEVLEDGASRTEDGVKLARAGAGSLVLQIRYVPYRRSGRITGAVIVAADVTEEYHLRESLKRRNEELETISRIGSKLNSTLDLEEISTTLARTIKQFHPDECISILLPAEGDGESEYFRAAATVGFPREYDTLGSRLRVFGSPSDSEEDDVWERQGLISVAARSGRAVNVDDVTQDSRYLEVLPATRSEMVVPMVVRDKVVGIIDIQSSLPGRFSADNVRRINTLANHAATAVENAHLHAKVWEMAQRDRLTGLRNLRFFEDRLKEELDRASRYDSPFSVIMMDIDDFKHYNDSFGHPMGNVLLRTVSRAIASALREVDILVRYGGEEFVCILPMTGPREAAEIAERIRRKVLEANSEIPHASEQPRECVSISLGVSSFLTDVRDRDRLLEVADERMYAAKRAGKNRVCSPALGNCPPDS